MRLEGLELGGLNSVPLPVDFQWDKKYQNLIQVSRV
jgi:hypothetical protein